MADPKSKSNSVNNPQAAADPKPRRGGRWFRRFLSLLVLVGISGWFAPTIISTPQVRDSLVKMVLPTSKGQIQFGETKLDWLSPILIKDIHLIDPEGTHLIEVAQFTSVEPLWKIASQLGMRGTLKFVNPIIRVSVTNNDSDLERFLAAFIGPREVEHQQPIQNTPTGVSTMMPAANHTIEIENASIELEHAEHHLQSKLESVTVKLLLKSGAVDEINLAIGSSPDAPNQSDPTNWLIAQYGPDIQPDANATVPGAKQITLKASKFKLDCLAPLLPRVSPSAEFHGEMDADSTLAMIPSSTGAEWDWNGQIAIQQFITAGFDAMKKDRLILKKIELAGRAAATSGRLAMHDVKLTTDVGEVTATGDIPLENPSQQSTIEMLQSLLSDEDYHISGHVDLKKLAAVLPQTLRIRDGIEITSGDISMEFVGAAAGGVRRWSGTAGISGLNAISRGQQIPWNNPLALRVNAHRDGENVIVDLIDCKSDFLQVSGKGTLDDAKFAATGDLAKLVTNIERFVDLGIDHLSGQLKASGEIRRRDQNNVALTSKIVLDGVAYIVNQKAVWQEQHLELSIKSTAGIDSKPKLTSIHTAEISLTSGVDRMAAVLQNPVDLTNSPRYSAKAVLKGDLASWQGRLQSFVPLNAWRLTGDIDLSTTINADSKQVDVSQFSLDLKRLEAAGPEWLVQDSGIRLETVGKWDTAAHRWTSADLNLKGEAVSMKVNNFEIEVDEQGIHHVVGTANYQADLTKISRWKNLAIPSPSYYLIGALTGTANLSQNGSGIAADLSAQVEKFILAGIGTGASGQKEWVALWKEPNLKISGKGSYDASSDKMTLDSSQIDAVGLSVAASGQMDQWSSRQQIHLTGDLAYDWDQLMTRLGPQVGQSILLSGKDHRPFSLRGTLASTNGTSAPRNSVPASNVSFTPGANVPPNGQPVAPTGMGDLTGQASVGWTTARLYGIPTGAGDLNARIEQGVCQFAPLDLVVSEGRVHVTPTIYFDRNPAVLVLPQEKLIDNINLTPEICSNSLKLIGPMLADTAQVNGKFSLDIQGANLPLFAMGFGTAAGVLSIHQAQARPGTAALQLVSAIDQVRSILARQQAGSTNPNQVTLQMPEQQVPFNLVQGRVYHQGMTFVVGNVSVKTSGSVGVVDNSLNLVAEIPVRDEWIGNNKTLAGLKGKTLQIPIVGTASRPQIDPEVFANLASQIGGSAIEGILQDKVGNGLNNVINNGLNDLLRGKK